MLHPSYSDLMAVVNSEVEPGEQPVVQSRYSIVMATSKRARQIITNLATIKSKSKPDSGKVVSESDLEFAKYCNGKKPLSIAVSELYEGKVKIVSDED